MCVADVAKYYIFLLRDFVFFFSLSLCIIFFSYKLYFIAATAATAATWRNYAIRAATLAATKFDELATKILVYRHGKSRHKAICIVLPVRKTAATFQRQHFSGNISAATFQRQHFSGNISAATFQRQHFSGNISAATFQRQHFSGNISAKCCFAFLKR